MKTTFKILIMAIAISLLSAVCAFGQVSVTGRVFAEVVESVSVKSNAITSFEISNTPSVQNEDNSTVGNNNANVNLGEIVISSGSNVGCNLVITPATFSNTSGENLSINPAPANELKNHNNLTNGNQTVALKGTAVIKQNQEPAKYQGTYSVILAYN